MMEHEDMSRAEQTQFLSKEFLITMGIQTLVFLVLGATAWTGLRADVDQLQKDQITAERIARIEEKVDTLIDNQKDFKASTNQLRDLIIAGDRREKERNQK